MLNLGSEAAKVSLADRVSLLRKKTLLGFLHMRQYPDFHDQRPRRLFAMEATSAEAKIFVASTTWPLVLCACAHQACITCALASAESTPHCLLIPALCT